MLQACVYVRHPSTQRWDGTQGLCLEWNASVHFFEVGDGRRIREIRLNGVPIRASPAFRPILQYVGFWAAFPQNPNKGSARRLRKRHRHL